MPTRLKSALALCAALLASPAVAGSFGKPPTPKVGERAPDFEATLYGGRKVSLSDYRGQVLVINFWATWCVPCKAELPLLDLYYRQRKDNGFAVVALTTEGSMDPSQLRPVREAVSFPMALRFSGPYRELDGVPTSYVIDRAGVVRWAKAGAFSLPELNKLLVPLINEKQPAAAAQAPAQ